jgi:hypothetical protein
MTSSSLLEFLGILMQVGNHVFAVQRLLHTCVMSKEQLESIKQREV